MEENNLNGGVPQTDFDKVVSIIRDTAKMYSDGYWRFSIADEERITGHSVISQSNNIKTSELLTFGQAIEVLKQGKKVARKGWNGKGMYLFLIGENGLKNPNCKPYWTYTNGVNDNLLLLPFIAMKTANDEVVPWLASQTDILSEDWEIVE